MFLEGCRFLMSEVPLYVFGIEALGTSGWNLFEGGVEVLDIFMVVRLPDVRLVSLRPTLLHVLDFSEPLFVFALQKVSPCAPLNSVQHV